MFQPRLAMFLLRLMPCLPCTYHVCRRSAEPRLDLQAATSSSALGQHICECTSSGYTRGVEIIRNHEGEPYPLSLLRNYWETHRTHGFLMFPVCFPLNLTNAKDSTSRIFCQFGDLASRTNKKNVDVPISKQ